MQSFEALNQRAVAVVVDPIQSVKGKVVIDAFRLINPQTMMLGQEPRQTTSNLGHLNKPSIQVSIPQVFSDFYSNPFTFNFLFRKVDFIAGFDSRVEQALLLHSHKLQEEWTWGEDAPQSSQEKVDWWIDPTKVWCPLQNKRADSRGTLIILP